MFFNEAQRDLYKRWLPKILSVLFNFKPNSGKEMKEKEIDFQHNLKQVYFQSGFLFLSDDIRQGIIKKETYQILFDNIVEDLLRIRNEHSACLWDLFYSLEALLKVLPDYQLKHLKKNLSIKAFYDLYYDLLSTHKGVKKEGVMTEELRQKILDLNRAFQAIGFDMKEGGVILWVHETFNDINRLLDNYLEEGKVIENAEEQEEYVYLSDDLIASIGGQVGNFITLNKEVYQYMGEGKKWRKSNENLFEKVLVDNQDRWNLRNGKWIDTEKYIFQEIQSGIVYIYIQGLWRYFGIRSGENGLFIDEYGNSYRYVGNGLWETENGMIYQCIEGYLDYIGKWLDKETNLLKNKDGTLLECIDGKWKNTNINLDVNDVFTYIDTNTYANNPLQTQNIITYKHIGNNKWTDLVSNSIYQYKNGQFSYINIF